MNFPRLRRLRLFPSAWEILRFHRKRAEMSNFVRNSLPPPSVVPKQNLGTTKAAAANFDPYAARSPASANCASSVEPAIAATDDNPPLTTRATSSKYPAPTSR